MSKHWYVASTDAGVFLGNSTNKEVKFLVTATGVNGTFPAYTNINN